MGRQILPPIESVHYGRVKKNIGFYGTWSTFIVISFIGIASTWAALHRSRTKI